MTSFIKNTKEIEVFLIFMIKNLKIGFNLKTELYKRVFKKIISKAL